MKLSVVMPAYNEEANILTAIERVTNILEELPLTWELILADDGSLDRTFTLMQQAADDEPRITVLRLSRNFGSHIAITAGLEHSSGDAALVITSDLQEPPELITEFVARWQEGYDIVWGVRGNRVEGFFSRLSSGMFHWLFRKVGLDQYSPMNVGGGYLLVDGQVIDVLRAMPERNRTLIGLISWMGFRHAYVTYQSTQRVGGRSTWTFSKKLKLAIDSFVAFSYIPIRVVSVAGLVISVFSALYGFFIIVSSLVNGVAVSGWPTLMVVVLFMGGAQFLVMGIMGEYIWRTLEETRQRPLYILNRRKGFNHTSMEKQ